MKYTFIERNVPISNRQKDVYKQFRVSVLKFCLTFLDCTKLYLKYTFVLIYTSYNLSWQVYILSMGVKQFTRSDPKKRNFANLS
jgi:hypothetical protein